MLANNAGALFASRKLTPEGFEQTFALNHLAPFLLTNLLLDRLDGGRVVTTASDAHTGGRLDLDDLQSRALLRRDARLRHLEAVQHPLHARARPARARAARQLLSPRRRAHRLRQERRRALEALTTLGGAVLPLARRGARSLVWLATSPEAAGADGEYVVDEKVAQPTARPAIDARAPAVGAKRRARRPPGDLGTL